MTQLTDAARAELAPHGRLRAALNEANTLLIATRGLEPTGVAPDLARELAKRAGASVAFVAYANAGLAADAAATGAWDVAFIGAEPQRAAVIRHSANRDVKIGQAVVTQVTDGAAVHAPRPRFELGDVVHGVHLRSAGDAAAREQCPEEVDQIERLLAVIDADEAAAIAEPFLDLASRQYLCEPREVWTSWPKPSFCASWYMIM